jgi:outer membrane protein assembly factor BamB
MPDLSDLKDALQLGLSVVSDPFWRYKTRDWVTCIHAADIDNDGEMEILVGSRDGRVHALASRDGICKWKRIVGSKKWIGAIIGIPPRMGEQNPVSVLVGTQDGKIYALDEYGRTISKDHQQVYPFENDGWAYHKDQDKKAFWHSSRYQVRWLAADLSHSTQVVIDSEDHYVYALDYNTGELLWTFPIGRATVQAVCSCDINGDGKVETLVITSDQHLYVLDATGDELLRVDVQGQIHAICAVDLNQDGKIEILLGVDGKNLSLLYFRSDGPCVRLLHRFTNRFSCLYVSDIDGDGENEILVGSEDRYLYILDANGKEIWRHFFAHRISSLYAADIDNDGLPEIFVGSSDTKESGVHALHIHLLKGLNERIHQLYYALDRSSPITLAEELSQRQYKLLQELVVDAKPTSKPVTLKQVESLMDTKKYQPALLDLLILEQQNVEQIWRVGDMGLISTVGLGNICSDTRIEVIVGTHEGQIYAFNWAGTKLWPRRLGGRITAVQTAYIDRDRYTRIIACSTDNTLYVISGVIRNGQKGHQVIGCDVMSSHTLDEPLTSFYVTDGGRRGPLDIIVGSKNKKIVIYRRDLTQPQRVIEPPREIRVVSAHITHKDDNPMIVAGSEGDVDHMVYAYTCHGTTPLWAYETKGRIEALCIREIDNEGNTQIIVGSQDRNVHVLDQHGKLKWRYYLPGFVLAVDMYDIDKDGKLEILTGCDDGQLYVFNQDGDVLWKYQAHGSILAVRARDIDNDQDVEIIIGSENQIEVLRVVRQQQLLDLINECWQALQQEKSEKALIEEFLNHQSPLLRSFALRKVAERKMHSPEIFDDFTPFIKDGSVEVRKALIQAVVACYKANPQHAQYMLSQLVMDNMIDVRLTLVRHIGLLMRNYRQESYWDDGLRLLQRFTRNNSRAVRRVLMRELCLLVGYFYGKPGRKRAAIELLLTGLLEPEAPSVKASDWVRQEAARTLAHFLDEHHHELLLYMQLFVVKGVKPEILCRVADHARTALIRDIFSNLGTLFVNLDETNLFDRLTRVVDVLLLTKGLKYGEVVIRIYEEWRNLAGLNTIEKMSKYQCMLRVEAFPLNTHFPETVNVFTQLNLITRALRLYLNRTDIKDRVNALLEANKAIERARTFAEQVYTTVISLGEPITKLPDYSILTLLFQRWQAIITSELLQLTGKAQLVLEMQTGHAVFEEQIVVCLLLRNKGDSTADNIHVELLNSEQFDCVGNTSFETEAIFPQDEVPVEFTIRPHILTPNLVFETVYKDTEITEQIFHFSCQLDLYTRTEQPKFKPIPNPYSTGVPTTEMCHGREDDLKFLQDNLTRINTGTFLILYGQRRSGKTTLLFQLANTQVLEPHISLRIDMQHESYRMSESKFFYNIAFYIFQALRKRRIQVHLDREKDFKLKPTFTLDRFLDRVDLSLEERKLIILIDEFEILETKVEKGVLAPEVFEYLRSVVQRHPGMTFLLAGVHTIRELTTGYWSPFYNIAVHYKLSKLSPQGALSLITTPIKGFLEYDPYALKKIRQLTADQPYLIHSVCRPLVDYCNEMEKAYVTPNDVNEILDRVMESSQHHFKWLWDQCSLDEHYVLAIVAELGGEEGRSLSLVEIEARYNYYALPYQPEAVLLSLKSLVERDMVEIVSNPVNGGASSYERYRLPVGLVREWIHRTKSVKQVRHEEEC